MAAARRTALAEAARRARQGGRQENGGSYGLSTKRMKELISTVRSSVLSEIGVAVADGCKRAREVTGGGKNVREVSGMCGKSARGVDGGGKYVREVDGIGSSNAHKVDDGRKNVREVDDTGDENLRKTEVVN